MITDSVIEHVCSRRVIPVVTRLEQDRVRDLVRALKRAGLPLVELTLRTESSAAVLRALAADDELLVGAGTVIRAEQVDLAMEAGARFVVTPGFSHEVMQRCREVAMAVIPGVATATDIIAALDHGCDVMKFFPAEPSGGTTALRALEGPFPDVRFVPTGGVNAANAGNYLRLRSVAAVGGSWMVAPGLLDAREFDTVTRLTAEAVALAAEARP
ncbi:MAG TPA: bifunctional 4-hydroxy-2-oxoglutarate aldolase/2-dehydro-3-deoxy-phosphogluconate aldolase [Solirubrobacteraceae bacterium]|nr:bifunctional 4-hydroxy-2-oxoglutarate aldolase/2-dehydro-3-deoxy-phosphogluconate aldolase [Solirubrobacteraceae bacterium]